MVYKILSTILLAQWKIIFEPLHQNMLIYDISWNKKYNRRSSIKYKHLYCLVTDHNNSLSTSYFKPSIL